MKRSFHILIAIILTAALAGCASPSYYQAAESGVRYFGYTDRQVDGALHRINFTARPAANFDQTYAYAIFRTAELAQSKGATHFEVLEGPVNKDAIERFIGKTTAANHGYQNVRYVQTQTYIYIPLQPAPPPVQISMLIRLLNAPSLDAVKGFDVNDLMTRLAPKIIRPPLKKT